MLLRITLFVAFSAVVFVGCEDNQVANDLTGVYLEVSVAPSTPEERQVIIGSVGVTFTEFRFSALQEDVTLTQVSFYNATLNTSVAINEAYLYAGTTLLGSTPMTGDYASFSGFGVIVPVGSYVELQVKCDLCYDYTIISSGMAPRLVILNVDSDVTASVAGQPLQDGGVVGDNGDTSVGYVNYGSNILAKHQVITIAMLDIAVGAGCPTGNQGSAYGFGTMVTIFEFDITVAGDPGSPLPREAILEEITLRITGDAEASDFELYWSEDGYTTPISSSPYQHVTTRYGGNPLNPEDHFTVAGSATFPIFQTIPHGDTVTFILVVCAYAVTGNNAPIRSLLVSIDHLGRLNTPGDVVYRDDGIGPWSHQWRWVYMPGILTVRHPSPIFWTTSSSSIQ
jgi:hypothetical protein